MTLDALNLMPVLPEILLLVLACAILLIDVFLREGRRDVTYWLSQASLAATFVAVWFGASAEQRLSFEGSVINDAMSDVMKLFILLITSMAFALSRDYLKERNIQKGEYYILGLFGVLGMMIMVSAYSLLLVYLGLELMSLAMYAMVAVHRDDVRASEAAMKYFVLGALASGLLLYGMSMLYGVTGSLDLSAIRQAVMGDTVSDTALLFAIVFMVAGLVFKLGAAPFHMWLPDVYDGAPTGVTLYLSAAPKIAALALLLRLLGDALGAMLPDWQNLLAVFAVASLFVGNVIAIAQTSFKRMLAYSTISHVGFILLGVMAGTTAGASAALFYAIAYALMSIGGFGLIVYLAAKGLEADQLDDLKGLNDRNPWMAFILLVLMFSMAGIPFTLGFWAKLAVLQAVVDIDMVWLAVYAVVMSVIGAFYYLRAVKMAYFDKAIVQGMPVRSWDARLVMNVNGLAIVALGLYPSSLIAICASAFNVL
ncbi:MAG: NADH-quinone oxidoreductase subunit NuoN [Halothiobacillaceae bacterium]